MIEPGRDLFGRDKPKTDWDARWMSLANVVAGWSKDRSTKVGCVIVGGSNQVLSLGYNGFTRGVDDDNEARHERPAKYSWTEHAERNAIYNAARIGTSLVGSTCYIPWFPCVDCARGIIQAGVKTIVAIQPVVGERPDWDASFAVAREMLREARVGIRWYAR